jgi:hypothetical protein
MTTYRSRLPCWLCVVDDIFRECVRGPRCGAVQQENEVVDNGAPGSEREGKRRAKVTEVTWEQSATAAGSERAKKFLALQCWTW